MERVHLAIWISVLLTEGLCSNVTSLGCKGSICYWVVGPSVRWPDAGKQCNDFNKSSLVTIEDEETNLFLWTRTFQHGLTPWIGVTYVQFPWQWVDGTPYTGNNLQGVDTCKHCALVILSPSNSEVNVTVGNCHKEYGHVLRPFICSKKGVTPTSSSITVHTTLETWHDARQRCRNTGLDLAVFPSNTLQSVVAHIKTQTSLTEFWIGLYKAKWISTSTGQELQFLRSYRCGRAYYLGASDSSGHWTRAVNEYVQEPSLCSLGGSIVVPTTSSIPSGFTTRRQDDPPGEESTSTGFDYLHKVIIPIVCILGALAIACVLGCLIWRKAFRSLIQNEVSRRAEHIQSSEANHKGRTTEYENPVARSKQDEPAYETIDGNAHPYVEILA